MISLVYTCIQGQRGRENPSLAGVIRKARRHAKRMSNPPLVGGNAIPMESEKSSYKCQQVKAKCQQIKAKYQEVIVKYNQIFAESIRYEQMHIKHEQTCECNSSMNDQHTKNKTEFIDQDNPVTTHALYTAEIKCVMSRGRRVLSVRYLVVETVKGNPPGFLTEKLSDYSERQELFEILPNHTLRSAFHILLS